MQLGEVAQLAVGAHLRVEAALLGHVAEAALLLSARPDALPADLAGVRFEDAEPDPHGGRLAGPVGAYEAQRLPSGACSESPSSATVGP